MNYQRRLTIRSSQPLAVALVRLCSTSKRRVARENMNGKHTPLFNPVLARPPRARSHKV